MNSPRIIRTVTGLRHLITGLKSSGKTIGFVPTMGALHMGHASLLSKARPQVDVLVSSIYANPTQFDNKEDLAKYPKTEYSDIQILKSEKVDIVFIPQTEDIYHNLGVTSVDYGVLTNSLEGAHRPGHFDGMTTIVRKLLQIVEPSHSFFGEKDWQQLAIINRMNQSENLSVKIIGCPIIREASGLAMSSRNVRLSKTELVSALEISKNVLNVEELAKSYSPEQLQELITQRLISANLNVDYVKVVNSSTLEELTEFNSAIDQRILIAAYAGLTRLIDNGPI